MAQQNKTQLKTYYQTGDTPTSDQYSELIDSQLNLAETEIQIGEFSISSSGNFKILGSASFVGDITSSGDIKSSGALTCTSLNTGQGDYELYAMNQNIRTTDEVTFAGINFTKSAVSAVQYGSVISTVGQSFTVTIHNVPAIGTLEYDGAQIKMNNASISPSSVIMVSSTSGLLLHTFTIANENASMRLQCISTADFAGGSVSFNFTII